MKAEEAMNDISFILQLKKNASQTKFSGVPTPEGPQGQVKQRHRLGGFKKGPFRSLLQLVCNVTFLEVGIIINQYRCS